MLWNSRLRKAFHGLQNTSAHHLQTPAPQHLPATVLGIEARVLSEH